MKTQKKKTSDKYEMVEQNLTSYAYIPEMKDDGSVFEKRKITSATFSPDKTLLILNGGSPDNIPYTIVLKSLRKIYSRIDREFDKIIINGFITVGEDFTLSDRYRLTIYLKGYPQNKHIGVHIKKALMEASEQLNS